VRIILATDGNKHGLKDSRYREFRQATDLLGVLTSELRFWNYPDGELTNYFTSLVEKIKAELEEFNPSIVFYPHPADRHPDHSVLGHAVEEVLSEIGDGSGITGLCYLVHQRYFPQPKKIRATKLLPPRALLNENEKWQRFCLPNEARAVKKKALREYRSQLQNPFLRPLLLGLVRENELFSMRIPIGVPLETVVLRLSKSWA
jgi:LmbE family N-acetylglucosaminyl deacetylase